MMTAPSRALFALSTLLGVSTLREDHFGELLHQNTSKHSREDVDELPHPLGDHIQWSSNMFEDFPAREILDENVLYVQYFPWGDTSPPPVYLVVKNPALTEDCQKLPGRKKGEVKDPRRECLQKTTGVDWRPGEDGMPTVDQIKEVDFLATSYKWTPPPKYKMVLDPLDPEGKDMKKVRNYPDGPVPTQRIFDQRMISDDSPAWAYVKQILTRLSGSSESQVKSSLEVLFALESEKKATFADVPRDCSGFFDNEDDCKQLTYRDIAANKQGRTVALHFNEGDAEWFKDWFKPASGEPSISDWDTKSSPFSKSLEAVFWTWAFKMKLGGYRYPNFDAHLRIRTRQAPGGVPRPYLERNCRSLKRICCCRNSVKDCTSEGKGDSIVRRLHTSPVDKKPVKCCKFEYFTEKPPNDGKCKTSVLNFGLFSEPDYPDLSPDSDCAEGDLMSEFFTKDQDTAANIIPDGCQDCGHCAAVNAETFLRWAPAKK